MSLEFFIQYIIDNAAIQVHHNMRQNTTDRTMVLGKMKTITKSGFLNLEAGYQEFYQHSSALQLSCDRSSRVLHSA